MFKITMDGNDCGMSSFPGSIAVLDTGLPVVHFRKKTDAKKCIRNTIIQGVINKVDVKNINRLDSIKLILSRFLIVKCKDYDPDYVVDMSIYKCFEKTNVDNRKWDVSRGIDESPLTEKAKQRLVSNKRDVNEPNKSTWDVNTIIAEIYKLKSENPSSITIMFDGWGI